ncbi:hypothetical protein Pan216_25010 [Planctomycetes bacterium Pan216]|uniref:HTH domain protein n=1 Tax=Kolteria novifilia TaxID=2527975 RepID=A0A518B3S6_9BACT|nr:hypothetical protein Pan216_25010 [Planctomycetes bacterium Pan216]
MAKRSAPRKTRVKISGTRAGRLYRLLKILSKGSAPRVRLLRGLRVGMRTFYRDIDLLRECGVQIDVGEDGYTMPGKLEDAISRIPFPDPELTFGDVALLMKGRTKSHQRLKQQFERLTK